jgi:hypothetical protein
VDPVAIVRRHGVLLESARGPIPNLAELVAGETIHGSWWGHPKSHEIYDALSRAEESSVIARTRLVGGKVTLIHRRLWAPVARLSHRLPVGSIDVVRSEHTASGAHRRVIVALNDWLPQDVRETATILSEKDAIKQIPAVIAEIVRAHDAERRP